MYLRPKMFIIAEMFEKANDNHDRKFLYNLAAGKFSQGYFLPSFELTLPKYVHELAQGVK